MRTRTFLLVALVGLTVAAGLLALASATDAPVLYALAVASIGLVLLARTLWTWSGDLWGWVTMSLTLLATIGVAWLAQRLAG